MNNAIEVTGLCKQYPDFSLQNVSFTVPAGSIVGMIGENGAGKTTTLRAILGALHPDAGEIRLLGQSPMDLNAKAQIGVVFSDAFFSELLSAHQLTGILASIQPSFDKDYWNTLLDRFSIPRKKQLKDLSLGMRAKVRLAAALSHHPKLLILDEATSGLDPVMRGEVLDMLWEFIQQEDHSVLMSTHITSDLEKIADSIIFIHNGQCLFQRDSDQLLQDFGILRANEQEISRLPDSLIEARREGTFGREVLVNDRQQAAALLPGAVLDKASIEDIMRLLAGRDVK